MLMLGLPILTRSRVLLCTRIQSGGCPCGQFSSFTRIFCTASPNIGQLLYFQTPLHFFSKINKICDHGRNMLTDSFLSKSWYARSYAVCSLSFFLSFCISTRIKEEKTRRCAGPGRASLSSALRARAALSEDLLIRLSSSHKEDY